MRNFYAEYAKERQNAETIEDECGFIQYIYLPDDKTVYVSEIYIAPEFRQNKGIGLKHSAFWKLTDKVVENAKTNDRTMLLARVVPSLPYCNEILQCHFRYGLRVSSATNDAIYTSKEI